jgi:hypothetical protein
MHLPWWVWLIIVIAVIVLLTGTTGDAQSAGDNVQQGAGNIWTFLKAVFD